MAGGFDWRTLTPDALEREFNPRTTVPDFQVYLDRTRELGVAARRLLGCEADVRYGPGERQLIDLFVAQPHSPCIVYVHGGYWRALSKEQFHAVALAFVPLGISVALVGYDLCPAVALDTCVAQIADALEWCARSMRERCTGPIHLCGSSAGAHLLAQALLRRGPDASRFASAWLLSGIYDLAPVLRISVNEDIRLDEAAAHRNSPVHHVRRIDTPVHIRVGSLESQAWISQSKRFHDACALAGCATTFGLLPDAHHFSTGLSIPGSALHHEMADLIGTMATSC